MGDGDVSGIAGPTVAPPMNPPPPRFCGDCTREPLAFWTPDDCNPNSTQLSDFAQTSAIQHPAFRAVSVGASKARASRA